MMFSRALYYPTIDIKNERWLKTAALFWDSIETIVPISKSIEPYKNSTAIALYDNNILKPHVVNPWCDDVSGLEDDVRRFISTDEGKRLLCKSLSVANRNGYSQVLGRGQEYDARMRQEYDDLYLHAEKLPSFLQEELRTIRNKDGFILTTGEFMAFYMTLLANNICRRDGLSLLTDRVIVNDLTSKVLQEKVGFAITPKNDESHLQTAFYRVILENIQIDPKTPVNKIVNFKREYADELARFRMEVSQLTNLNNGGDTFKSISNQARDIYENGVAPSVNDLKRALGSSTIKWVANNSYNYIISGIVPTALTFLGMPKGGVFTIGAGLALSYTLIGRWINQNENMRNSPYAYLIRTRRKFAVKGRN